MNMNNQKLLNNGKAAVKTGVDNANKERRAEIMQLATQFQNILQYSELNEEQNEPQFTHKKMSNQLELSSPKNQVNQNKMRVYESPLTQKSLRNE